jgi:hypothetical protein
VDFDTAAEHTDFGKGDGSLPARLSCPDRSAPEAAEPLTMSSDVRCGHVAIAWPLGSDLAGRLFTGLSVWRSCDGR